MNRADRKRINQAIGGVGILGHEWHAVMGTLVWMVEQGRVTIEEVEAADADTMRRWYREANGGV